MIFKDIRLALVVLTCLAGSMVTITTPASAGLVRVSNSSNFDSTDAKLQVVSCPSPKKLASLGAEITGGLGEVMLNSLQLNSTTGGSLPDSVLAQAAEMDTYSESWTVTAHAICAYPPPGLELVMADSDANPSDPKSVIARCPAGKKLLATGFYFAGGGHGITPRQLQLESVRPRHLRHPVTEATCEELAKRTGTHPRYAREWLDQQAVTGLLPVENDDGDDRGARSGDDAAMVLSYLAPVARILAAFAGQLPALLDAYRSGGGVGWAQYGPDAASHRPT